MNKSFLSRCSFLSSAALLLTLLAVLSVTRLSAQILYVGSNTPNQTTNFTSGTNGYYGVYVGFGTSASNNTLNVANTNTLLSDAFDVDELI